MQNHKHQSLKVNLKVDAIQDGHATLVSDETGEIRWPTSKLPEQTRIGDRVTVNVCANENCSEPEHLRALLEELLS